MANWLSRLVQPLFARSAAEGQYRPGPYLLGDGWLSATAGRILNWWQSGYSLNPYGESGAMVEACVSAYSQTVAMCPGDHWKSTNNGGRERITNSSLARIIRRPNDYQSMSDLLLNVTRRLFEKGETFGLVIRNGRTEIDEIHWMRNGLPRIAEDGSIFYSLSGNEIIERKYDLSLPIPARDVLHIRLHTPRHPLKGESPILATVLDRAMSGAALNQQVAFYLNQARPSYILETDEKLTPDQTRDLRARWLEQTTGENVGSTPILGWGLTAKPVTATAKDGELAEILKMSDQNVALAFRMPLQVLGIGNSTMGSTEQLMQAWVASGLGFALNHIEEAFGLLFDLKGYPEEYLEFSTKALLRSAFRERIEGLARGVQGGIYSPDEARGEEELPTTPGGNSPMMQEQNYSLAALAKRDAKEDPFAGKATATPPAKTVAAEDESEKGAVNDNARHTFRAAHARTVAL